PRGSEEGSVLELDLENLQLVANKPVSFRLYSSRERTEDQLGDVVEFTQKDLETGRLHRHAPLNAVIRFGKKAEERLIPVKLGARLTEVGTLEIWAESKVSEHRWRLQFELRKAVAAPEEEAKPARPAAVISDEAMAHAEALIRSVFAGSGAPDLSPQELPGRLEQVLGLGRNSWPGSTIRRLADVFLEHAEGRRKGPAFEARWLNLCGFCLRPGFGFPGDDYRIELARRVYASGLAFPNHVECEIQWWIFWGRVAGGLNRNQQADLYQRIAGTLLPRGKKKPPRVNASLLREMWRTAASLELLPIGTRTDLGEALLNKISQGEMVETALWCLARLGARELFYGPINQVLPPATATRWVESLLKIPAAGEAIASIARHTGDSSRDLSPGVLELVRRDLSGRADGERLLATLEGESARDLAAMGRIFGEELPSGLVFAQQE
ncbi:MAG: molecular chaperone DnaK, partial [Bryobacteraceae bacterium]|nr:molecular chaperone DnaK [Bryobacteraceae bacterium]